MGKEILAKEERLQENIIVNISLKCQAPKSLWPVLCYGWSTGIVYNCIVHGNHNA